MRTISILLGILLGILAFGYGAVADDPKDRQITTLTRAEILGNPDRLPRSGYLSTGQPDKEVLVSIATAGFAAVVDLRGADEDRGLDERDVVESLGMQYVSLPIPTPDDATFEHAAMLDGILAGIEGRVLLHCASGNRVGSLFALNASASGLTPEEALAVGKTAGLTRWEKQIREKLESESIRPQ